ncbi:hypothetical protein [Polyangium spumosum]|nr:hypothetical protein [Polyangium spumosum]
MCARFRPTKLEEKTYSAAVSPTMPARVARARQTPGSAEAA